LQTLPTSTWVPVSLLIYGLSDHGIYWRILVRWGRAQKA
jgi:hypothetical protein